MFCVLLQKNETSSHSFTFFAKERCILFALFCSLEKNVKERNVLLGLISRKKLKKRMEKNVTYRTEKNGVPNPAKYSIRF